MQVIIHLPRRSEAEITPLQEEDLVITPKFYKKTGWIPILHFTTTDARGNEEQHVLSISAATKLLRIDKLVEVIPECDDGRKREKKEIVEELVDQE